MVKEDFITPLGEAVIYKFGRKVRWSKTGQIPYPLYRRIVEGCCPRRADLVIEDLGEYIIVRKRQRELVAQFSEKGFRAGLRIRDKYSCLL